VDGARTGAAALPLLFALPGAQHLAEALLPHWQCEPGTLTLHRFPDQECCPRFGLSLAGRDVVLVAHLDRPDAKLLALYLCASVARELGARSVGLVLPYLPYMRQDSIFEAGQGITACHIARLLSSCANWLATVDPHLHRFSQLGQVYTIPALALPSAPTVARWIQGHVSAPLIVGPDSESAQWVEDVAALVQCPFLVMHKDRRGDRDVSVVLGSTPPGGRTPVLLDDIVSSGRTMAAAVALLREAGTPDPVCIIVHALFGAGAMAVLERAGPAAIVSCNTIEHSSNAIDIGPALAQAASSLLTSCRKAQQDAH
jgi:ribose-phosphate pyrophosphokinase